MKAGPLEFRHHTKLTDYPASATVDLAINALVIPLTHPIVNKASDGGAETLTLANGEPGQMIMIHLGTAGGGQDDVTPATTTGFTSIALVGAEDQCVLYYVDDTIGWIIIGVSGTDAPPVVT